MAKPTYKVWVANLVSLGTKVYDPSNRQYYFLWDQAMLSKTVAELKDLFTKVCNHPVSKFADVDVNVKDLNAVSTSIKSGELLIRLTSKKDSALMKKYGQSAVSNDTSGGTMDTGSGIVSEAWIEGAAGSATVPELLARLAFHELMHNKLDAGNSKDIHTKPDDGTGLALSPVAYNTDPSDTNKRNMALKLGSIGTQFTGATIP